MKKKYELIESDREGLYRIKALRDFCNDVTEIKKGDIGGYVASEDNLSHEGNCWLFDDATVYDKAYVSGNAFVCGNVQIYGHALVTDNTFIGENARIFDHAIIDGRGYVCDHAQIYGHAKVRSHVHGWAEVYDHAVVQCCAYIGNNAKVYGNTVIDDSAMVVDDAKIYGNAKVKGSAYVCSDAIISSINDYIVIKNNWSSGRYITWTRSNNMWRVGCFHGTSEELIKKAYADSYEKGKCYEATVKYVKTINRINSSDDGE